MIALALQSTFVFGLAAAANVLMTRTSAAQRHAIWMLAFASVPLLLLAPYLSIPTVAVIPVASAGGGSPLAAVAGGSTQSIGDLKLIWTVGTLLLLLRLAFSFVWFRHHRDAVTMPVTFGPFRPAIHLPPSAAEWPAALRRSVMMHEEAHVRRRDPLAQFFSQIVCAFLWFQPLAWYAAGRAAEERERACDDLVLAGGVDAPVYAEHLVEIAREFAQIPAVAMGIAGTSGLERRLRALTDRSLSRAALTFSWRACLAASLACVVLGVSGMCAQQTETVYKPGEGGVTPPKVKHQVNAVYGPDAQAQHITGDVALSMEIDKEGKPRNVKVVDGLDPELDKNAVEAMNQWRFDPATKDGRPVACSVIVKVRFRLK